MSYNFYVQSTGNDNNSGSSASDSPIWTGTVTCAGSTTTLTKASGADWTAALVGQFIRIDPGGANDCNLRIVSVEAADSLTLAENGPTVTGATGNIGGALASLDAAFGTDYPSASVIPYGEAGKSVDSDVTVWIKAATYVPSAVSLLVTSATQDTNKMARRFIGYVTTPGDGGFVNGVFSGPTIDTSGMEYGIILDASNLLIEALKISGTDLPNCGIVITDDKPNLVIRQCWINGGYGGIAGNTGHTADVIECLCENVAGTAYYAQNSRVARCKALNSAIAFAGLRTTFDDCIEEGTTCNIVLLTTAPGSCDFSRCEFRSDKPWYVSDHCSVNFELCSFVGDQTAAATKNIRIVKCTSGGTLTNAATKYHTNPSMQSWDNLAGYDTRSGVWTQGQNKRFAGWPDAYMAANGYEPVGVHGLPVPISLTRRRFFGRGPTKRDLMKT